MGWRAAERNPHFCQRPWQAALLAAAVVAMVALVQAQDAPDVHPPDGSFNALSRSRQLLQKCTGGTTLCSGTCKDLKNDASNCGVCGSPCTPGSGQICKAGRCQCVSPKEIMCTDGTCVNIQADNSNCGACGAVCAAGSVCQAGHCTCPTGGQLNTTANCGSCGYVCPTGQRCLGGVCCQNCGGASCIDLLTSVANCGTCGHACPAPSSLPNVTSVGCSNGTCIITACADGYADCNGVLTDGCEINIYTDINHCGACNTTATPFLNAAPACEGGVSVLGACNPGSYDCDGDTTLGCELQAPLNNSSIQCDAYGGYTLKCAPGFYDCDGIIDNGCEVSVPHTRAASCYLDGNDVILYSVICAAGFVDCDNDRYTPNGTGCETPLPPNTSGSQCNNYRCLPGFADCDGNMTNGCEINLMTDIRNCGACNANYANAPSAVCYAGRVALGTCTPGQYDCDGDPTNGCETPISALPAKGNCLTKFTPAGAPQQWVAPPGVNFIQILVVAGGGAGGGYLGGGGGAGGLINSSSYPVRSGVTYSVSVGAGGQGFYYRNGANGQDSIFGSSDADTLRAVGGAGGLSSYTSGDGAVTSGGSGGGQAQCWYSQTCPTSSYTSGQGFPGGRGIEGYFASARVNGPGGGGGAGGAGGDTTRCSAGAGGPGLPFDIETPGADKFYAGGGGGSLYVSPYNTSCSYHGAGGSGVGGAGEDWTTNTAAVAGAADTGSGGGGGFGGPGASGGSGVVILRY